MVNVFRKAGSFGRKPNENDRLLADHLSEIEPRKWYSSRNVLLLFIVLVVLVALFGVPKIFEKFVGTAPTRLTSMATVNNEYYVQCGPRVTCDPGAKYRTTNGSCNNLQEPTWGASLTPFYRYVDPEFSDGISKFRVQSDGSSLPNARQLTLTLFKNVSKVCDHKNNELLVPWAQLVAHDIAFSPVNSVNSTFPDALSHCGDENPPVECAAAIPLYPDDPVYGTSNMTILKFMRLVTSANYSCPLVPATVLNENTHYIDASVVYGSDTKVAHQLRMFSGGKLRYDKIGKQVYCPQDPTKTELIGNQTEHQFAFLAGDVNVNQNLNIALFQNLFLRFHNYIANELQLQHPSWTDEIVYQETRRIVAAVVQIITYDHFLPIVLGDQYMNDYGLNSATNYDPTISTAVAQEMTSGAYRVLHNIIPAHLNFMSENYTVYQVEDPSKTFLIPNSIVGNVDGLLRGLVETPGREPQPAYNDEITNMLFNTSTVPIAGFDLLSYDIQRGRDVGLPPYTTLRAFCGLSQIQTFEDLSDDIPPEKIELLKSFYATVDDIDYYVGILLENTSQGSMVGPTGSCIIADSFYRLRNGDRFFYDVQGQPGSFTPDQIESLKNITLSHVICATSNVDHVQTDTFSLVDHIRLMKLKPSCKTYHIDLTAW